MLISGTGLAGVLSVVHGSRDIVNYICDEPAIKVRMRYLETWTMRRTTRNTTPPRVCLLAATVRCPLIQICECIQFC